jgi:hypothetical protein
MNKQFIYFTSILALMIVTIAAVPAQEGSAALTNITVNNTTLNAASNETLNATANETLNATAIETLNTTANETLNATTNGTLNTTTNGTLNATAIETSNATANETLNANSSENPAESSIETPIETLNQTDLNSTPLDNESVSTPVLAASEENTASNNTSLNATFPALNETSPAQNATAPENVTATVKPENNASTIAELSGSQATSSAPNENTVFTIGSGLKSNQVFQVNRNAQPRDVYELGMPIKPVRDVDNMFFVCDII